MRITPRPALSAAGRLGEWLWRMHDDRFTVVEMLRVFREASLGEFLGRFSWAGVHAFTAWALTAPLLIGALYYGLRPALHRLASKPRIRT